MADGASTSLEEQLYNQVFRSSTSTLHAALFSIVSNNEDGIGVELTDAGYSRQTTSFSAPVASAGQNSSVITFGPFTSSGTIIALGMMAGLSSAITITRIRELLSTTTFANGDYVVFSAGSILIAID